MTSARIAVVADLNNNLVDGSVVWLRNIVTALSEHLPGDVEIVLLLREDPKPESMLFPPDQIIPRCHIVSPASVSSIDTRSHTVLEPNQLSRILNLLEARYGLITSVLVRGRSFASELLKSERFAARLCLYMTDRPRFASIEPDEYLALATRVTKHLLVQSPIQKRYLETYLQVPARKISVIPPMVAVARTALDLPPNGDKPAVLSYAGKIDKDYCIEELVKLAPAAAELGFNVSVVGNKINRDPVDTLFVRRIRDGLANTPAVHWLQGATHGEVQRLMEQARFGYCFRAASLDNSVEISTKLLEYSAAGTPPLVRRTSQHVSLFGPDYPYFVDSPTEILDLLTRSKRIDDMYRRTQVQLRELARGFHISVAAKELLPLCEGAADTALQTGTARPRQILIATHELKFLEHAVERLRDDERFRIQIDRWQTSRKRGTQSLPPNASSADVVYCEWCCEQAVWWSENKSPSQKLVVRLHRFEIFEDYPKRIRWENVDNLIVVSDHFKQVVIAEFGVHADRIHVLPQYVDTSELDRPKLHDSRRTLGLVGILSHAHKRPDRALDVLRYVRQRDRSFKLRVRSAMPWNFNWFWRDKPQERPSYTDFFRIAHAEDLAGAVVFDPPGSDMAEWYRGVGHILSTSDSEGCHTAVAEGMASGCLPICYDWPGAASVYSTEYVHQSVESMGEAILDWNGEIQPIKVKARDFDISYTVDFLKGLFS